MDGTATCSVSISVPSITASVQPRDIETLLLTAIGKGKHNGISLKLSLRLLIPPRLGDLLYGWNIRSFGTPNDSLYPAVTSAVAP